MKSLLRLTLKKENEKREEEKNIGIEQTVAQMEKATKIFLNNFISLRVSMLFLQYKSCYFKHIAELWLYKALRLVHYIQPFE